MRFLSRPHRHSSIILKVDISQIVWWMGMDYELFYATLSTHSDLLVIHSLGYFSLGDQFISLIYTIPHTHSWVSVGVHTLAKNCFSSLFGSHPPD